LWSPSFTAEQKAQKAGKQRVKYVDVNEILVKLQTENAELKKRLRKYEGTTKKDVSKITIQKWHNVSHFLGQGTYAKVYASSVAATLDERGEATEWSKGEIPIALKCESIKLRKHSDLKREEGKRKKQKQQFDLAIQTLSQCRINVLPMINYPGSEIGILPQMMIVNYLYSGVKTTRAVTIMGSCESLYAYITRVNADRRQAEIQKHDLYLKQMLRVLEICNEIGNQGYFHEDLKTTNLGVNSTGNVIFLDLDSLKPMNVLQKYYTTTYNSIKSTDFNQYQQKRTWELQTMYKDKTLKRTKKDIEQEVATEVTQLIFWSGQIATIIEMLHYAKIPEAALLFEATVISKDRNTSRFSHINRKANSDLLKKAAEKTVKVIANSFDKCTLRHTLIGKIEMMIAKINTQLIWMGENALLIQQSPRKRAKGDGGGPAN